MGTRGHQEYESGQDQHIIRAGRQLNPPVVVWRGDSAFSTRSTRSHHFGHTSRAFGCCEGPNACEGRGTQDSVESCRGHDRPSVRVVHSLFLLRHKGVITSAPSSQRGPKKSQQPTTPRSAGCSTVSWTSKDQSTFNFATLPLGGVGFRSQRSSSSFVAHDPEAPPGHLPFHHRHSKQRRWEASYGSSCANPRKPRRIGFRCSGVGRIWQGGFVQISIQQQTSPSLSRNGWQQKASDVVENVFLALSVWPTLAQPEQALLRSQQGPMAGLPFHQFASFCWNNFPVSGVQGTVSSSPLATLASVFVHLPMRPTTRLSWPSSRSVSVSRGVGAPGIHVGKCSCPCLPGGKRKGHNECAGAGHGSPSSPTNGQPQTGSRC